MTELLPDIFAIEVPDKSSLFELNNGCELFLLPHSGHSVRKKWAVFPPDSYEIMFTMAGATEEQAALVSPGSWSKYFENAPGPLFMDYSDNIYRLHKATESLQSLLKSKGLTAGNYLIIKKVAD